MAEEIDVIDEDEIGLALGTAWETIDDFCDQPLYRDPALAAWIQSVRNQMEELQAYLFSLTEAQEPQGGKPAPRVVHTEAPDDGSARTLGRVEIPTARGSIS